jgi:hypothetical protein
VAVLSEGDVLRAVLLSPDGAERVDGEGPLIEPERLARDLLSRAPASISAHFTGSK